MTNPIYDTWSINNNLSFLCFERAVIEHAGFIIITFILFDLLLSTYYEEHRWSSGHCTFVCVYGIHRGRIQFKTRMRTL